MIRLHLSIKICFYLKTRTASLTLLWRHKLSGILRLEATVFFELEVKGGCTNTLDLFSWSDRAWLVLCRWPFPVLGLPGWALSALYTGREVVEKGKAGSCYWHVCISNNTDKKKNKKKRITVDVFSLLKDTCVMLHCIVGFSDQCIHTPWKS